MALELLTTFIPDEHLNQTSSFPGQPVDGAVLDVDFLRKLLNDENLVNDCISLLLTGLSGDLIKLSGLHQARNWKEIQAIAHTWLGGSSYCGTKRLEQACEQLSNYLRTTGPGEQIEILYQQLIQEMLAVKEAIIKYHT